MNLMTHPVSGRASGVGLEETESLSSVAAMLVVRVPKAFIQSLKVASDLSAVVAPPSNEIRSVGRWPLFLILVVSPFLVGFIHVFDLGAIVSERIVRKRNFI